MSELLTVNQLADRLNVSERTIRNWQTDRVIPFLKIRNVVRFDIDAVEAALAHYVRKAGAQ